MEILLLALIGTVSVSIVLIMVLCNKHKQINKQILQQQKENALRISELEEENNTLNLEIEFLKKIYREKLLLTHSPNLLRAVTKEY